MAKNTLYSTILAGNNLFFFVNENCKFFGFIAIQLSLEILFLPIYFEVFCPFVSAVTCKTCAYVFEKLVKRPPNVKKAFKTPKFTTKTKGKKNFEKKTKGGVKDEPALQLSPVSGKHL